MSPNEERFDEEEVVVKKKDRKKKDALKKYFWSSEVFITMKNRLDKWEKKYPDKPFRVLLKMVYLCISVMIFRTLRFLCPCRFFQRSNTGNVLQCLVYLRGGIGDIVIGATYLKELYKWSDVDCQFVICTDQNKFAVESLFDGYPFVKQVFTRFKDRYISDNYDLVLDINRFPRTVQVNHKRVQKIAPRLYDLLSFYKVFEKRNDKFYRYTPFTDALGVMYALMNGHTRRTQPDVGHRIGLDESTRSYLALPEEAFAILGKYNLADRFFVTLQRGTNVADKIVNNVRDWPVEYYNTLIRLLKERYPSLVVLQLGKKFPSVDLDGVDVDLRGQTTFDELKVILKRSTLHIDGECGMVHLTHALYGRSAVFFAQTRVDFCGYPENINIKAEGTCPLWCEWVTNDWQKRCVRGFDNPPCMQQLTPDLVLSSVEPYLDRVLTGPKPRLVETSFSSQVAGVICFVGKFTDDFLLDQCKSGNQVYLFDTSLDRARIQKLKEKGITADFGDMHNIPMSQASCDCVWCDQVDPSVFVLDEMTRVLKPGGTVVKGNSDNRRCFVKEV
ncbi:MAG: methyltransferase domain-containing protein [Planctomycetia bacterium]|nr:methyltransferase domain-containing protein [Planctomycetia bacterium]